MTGNASSTFTPRKVLTLRETIGRPIFSPNKPYNEFIAFTETAHELTHALRMDRWVKEIGSLESYWKKYKSGTLKYAEEEIRVERAAQEWMKKYANPRVNEFLQHGNKQKAQKLQNMLNDAIEDSNLYIATLVSGLKKDMKL